MSTHVLTNGFYFDLGVIALVVIVFAVVSFVRWIGRSDQHLAETQRPSFPQGTHEGDWDWPRALETDHRLRRP